MFFISCVGAVWLGFCNSFYALLAHPPARVALPGLTVELEIAVLSQGLWTGYFIYIHILTPDITVSNSSTAE